jgi:hypothetical protein
VQVGGRGKLFFIFMTFQSRFLMLYALTRTLKGAKLLLNHLHGGYAQGLILVS